MKIKYTVGKEFRTWLPKYAVGSGWVIRKPLVKVTRKIIGIIPDGKMGMVCIADISVCVLAETATRLALEDNISSLFYESNKRIEEHINEWPRR